MASNPDYVFYFVNGVYDEDIFMQYQNPTDELRILVQDVVGQILKFLSRHNIKEMTQTVQNIQDEHIHVCLTNPNYVPY